MMVLIKRLGFFFIIALMILFTCFSSRYIAVTLDGIRLWAVVILPSLFPYIVLTTLLTENYNLNKAVKPFAPVCNKLFRTPSISTFVLFLSLLSGYPIGAKLIADLYENNALSTSSATKTATFAITCGPVFVIGSIGSIMLKNTFFGVTIYLSHIIANLLTGVIFRNKFLEISHDKNATFFATKKPNFMLSAVFSVLTVGAYITLFYTLTEMLLDFKILSPFIILLSQIFKSERLARGLIVGIFECTKGAKILASSSSIFTLPLISAIISFGGLSVIMQCLAFLKKTKIKTAFFILTRIIQAVLSFIICLIIVYFSLLL